MGKTIISWATHVWNPVTGCSKPAAVTEAGLRVLSGIPEAKWLNDGTSPECARCYAETLSLKRGWTKLPWTEANAAVNVLVRHDRLAMPLRLQKVAPRSGPPSQRTRVFTNSMTDLFHAQVPDSFLRETFEVMLRCQDVIFQVLTKRIDRAAAWEGPWPANIWLGTTCGHPATKWRLDYLRQSKAAVRFVSIEPLLASLVPVNLDGIHQVLVGGESGSGFRPMKMEWARELRDACKDTGTAYFFKQDSAFRTETRCYLVERDDATCWQYRQFPGELSPPIRVEPDNPKWHRQQYPVLQ